MATGLSWAAAALAAGGALGLAGFAASSARERERRAAALAGLGAAGAAVIAALVLSWPSTAGTAVAVVIVAVSGAAAVLFFAPIGRRVPPLGAPTARFDERDIMFARARLVPGSPEYETYYALRPQNREPDDLTRSLPGLGSPRAGKADAWAFAAMDASFSLTGSVRGAVDGPVAADRTPIAAELATSYVKGLARYWGARSVGVTALRPYHAYSHVGRGEGVWGSPIALDHRYAIALTVEMDLAHVRTGPEATEVMESAKQYVEAARVALQLGNLIRSLGYPARAHIDGNYQVIAPLVAQDAGLGTIGRMGLLMTPELGPRVRLAVVTTDLPLVPDGGEDGGSGRLGARRARGRDHDRAVLDFCRICEKCTRNCPSRSIPAGDRQEIDGALRWRIDADSCFRYWNSVGTDCGRCMSVCPYSHADGGVHAAVRWAIRRSGAARRAALWADDVFYGRRPAPGPRPNWLPRRTP